MSWKIYYQRNRAVILNRAKDYKCRNLSKEEEEEEKRRQNIEKTDIIICLKKRNKN